MHTYAKLIFKWKFRLRIFFLPLVSHTVYLNSRLIYFAFHIDLSCIQPMTHTRAGPGSHHLYQVMKVFYPGHVTLC